VRPLREIVEHPRLFDDAIDRGRPINDKASTLDRALLLLVTEMNLFGTVYSCNSVADIMKRQRPGKIMTVSSVAGMAPSAGGGYAHLGAAKAPSPISRDT
jgi:3-oxoacyl-[acyl-carrier protein] reductase